MLDSNTLATLFIPEGLDFKDLHAYSTETGHSVHG